MRPYLAILSARFRALLQYRAAAIAGLGTQVFWGLIRMMIFIAFYENAPSAPPMQLDQVVAYIWLGQAFLMLLPGFHNDTELEMMIRTGNISYELLRPVDLYNLWLSRSIAGRIAPTALRAAPILVLAAVAGWIRLPSPAGLAAFAAAIIAAAVLSSAICTVLTITMFWTTSGQGIARLSAVAIYFLSGIVIPLPLFPDFMQPILNVLPFRGLMDVPFRLYTGHIAASDGLAVIGQQLAWTAALMLFGRWLLSRGLRRVVVQGG